MDPEKQIYRSRIAINIAQSLNVLPILHLQFSFVCLGVDIVPYKQNDRNFPFLFKGRVFFNFSFRDSVYLVFSSEIAGFSNILFRDSGI